MPALRKASRASKARIGTVASAKKIGIKVSFQRFRTNLGIWTALLPQHFESIIEQLKKVNVTCIGFFCILVVDKNKLSRMLHKADLL